MFRRANTVAVMGDCMLCIAVVLGPQEITSCALHVPFLEIEEAATQSTTTNTVTHFLLVCMCVKYSQTAGWQHLFPASHTQFS